MQKIEKTTREEFLSTGKAEFPINKDVYLSVDCGDYQLGESFSIGGFGTIYVSKTNDPTLITNVPTLLEKLVQQTAQNTTINLFAKVEDASALYVSFPDPTIDRTNISTRLGALYDAVEEVVRRNGKELFTSSHRGGGGTQFGFSR